MQLEAGIAEVARRAAAPAAMSDRVPDTIETVFSLRFPESVAERERARRLVFERLWERMGDYGDNKESCPASLYLANNAEIAWVSAAILGEDLGAYVEAHGERDTDVARELMTALAALERFRREGDEVPEHVLRRHDVFYEGYRDGGGSAG